MTTHTTHAIYEDWLDGLHGPMRYWHSDPRHGLPVVLIHGYGGMIEHWRAVMRTLARDHSIIAPDLYYFGQSAIPDVSPGRSLWSDQIAELIAEVCHRPAIVVGHSLGGMVAAQVAHDYPQLVQGLVLVDSTGVRDPQYHASDPDHFFFQLIRSPGLGEVMANLVANSWGTRHSLFTSYYDKDRVTPELIEQFSAPLNRPGGRDAYLRVSRSMSDLFLDFPKGAVSLPTLLIWGERDESVPPDLALSFKRNLLPHAEIAMIPESGHCPFDETPQEFCDILLPWLGKVCTTL